MASKAQEALLRVGAVVEDRDPRMPGRSGRVVEITRTTIDVDWITGRRTRFNRQTWGERFRVVTP